MSSLHDLRAAAHDHVLRNTVLPDAAAQRLKQRLAAEKFEQAEKEKADYLASLEIPPPSPQSAPSARLSKFIPNLVSKLKQGRMHEQPRVSRAQQKETKNHD